MGKDWTEDYHEPTNFKMPTDKKELEFVTDVTEEISNCLFYDPGYWYHAAATLENVYPKTS